MYSIDYEQFYKEFGIKIKYSKVKPTLRDRNIVYLRKKFDSLHKRNYNFHTITEENCAASLENDKNSISPFYNLEYIDVVDLIPKEYLPELKRSMRKFLKKYQSDSIYNFNRIDEIILENYMDANNGFFQASLVNARIKENTLLGNFISTIEIEVFSLSSTFVGIIFKTSINQKWMEIINNLCIENRDNQMVYAGHGIKWYQVSKANVELCSGIFYKADILNILLYEIKYRIAKEISKFIRLILFEMGNEPVSMCIINTNIDKNTNEYFWKSVGVETKFCNYSKIQDSCIINKNFTDLTYIYKTNDLDKYIARLMHMIFVPHFLSIYVLLA